MKIQNRKEFLEQHWVPYPSMPTSVSHFGRIIEIQTHSISLETHFSITTIDTTSPSWIYSKNTGSLISFEPQSLFIVNDQVSLDPSGVWTLLTPHIHTETDLKKSLVHINNPEQTKTHFQNWSKYLNLIRTFFESQNFLEIYTPSLVTCPGTEPSLEVFKTEWIQGKKQKNLYLRTSPEIFLKKYLSLGFLNIFEMAHCYRNDENSEHHLNEFFMLEWYRGFNNLESIKKDVMDLLNFIVSELKLNLKLNFLHTTMADLFKEILDFNLTPQTTYEEYFSLCLKHNLISSNNQRYTIDDLFFLLFVSLIEPQLDKNKVVFVSQYPPFQSALARLTSEGWADRFEVYWKGLELANAFHELNDPEEQLRRSQEDLKKKTLNQKVPIELDEAFFNHLRYGLPPSGGIALGLERLFMALYDLSKIHDLRPLQSIPTENHGNGIR
ncbi:MAG TPA: EF-P lysine aminoacylase GenX [Pseudobdellovibrionaceae bacterium]|nr:EF-P lysine aminoacylase GenX [Pseudobdellovibrionaceae bacterium]